MGLYDRDYYQDDYQPRGMGTGGGNRMMVTNIVIVTAALFVLNLFTKSNWLMDTMAVTSDVIRQPWNWWKFLTYGFAHDPGRISHVFWNMVGLWIFGRDVEGAYGAKEFLRIYLVALVLGSLVWAVRIALFGDPTIMYVLWGASGAVTAVILLFVFHFPHRTILLMFVLPVPAWVLGLLIIGGNLLNVMSSSRPSGVAFDVHLVGALFAILYFKSGLRLDRLFPGFGELRDKMRMTRAKRRFKIHDPDKDRKQDQEADRILDKVNREGMDSLTAKEKRALAEYSRRMREKRSKD